MRNPLIFLWPTIPIPYGTRTGEKMWNPSPGTICLRVTGSPFKNECAKICGSSRQGCKSNGVRVPYRQLPDSDG
jgi:hypothetical protein